MSELKAIEIQHCQAGSVTSRQDGSVKISFVTPELRPSEGGALLLLHGKNVCVSIVPEDQPIPEKIMVKTEREGKSPSQRFRGVLWVAWEQEIDRREDEPFEAYYLRQYQKMIDHWKQKLRD